MASGWVGLFLLCWFSFLLLSGVTFFTKGFLLSRHAIATNSSCEGMYTHLNELGITRDETYSRIFGAEHPSCWIPRRFDRAVIVVIDGLRHDFTLFDKTLGEGLAKPYQNKFPVIDRLVRGRPDNAALFRFVADPPTTTMQRIKGLITGSLPTFVDAGDNFASFEIGEDNLIDQFAAAGRRTVFLGDDTWTGLLPGRFDRAVPFPSFDVRDLHTVDDGVTKHLLPLLRGGGPAEELGWDVIVAHFLGVDHCGHIYGPGHPVMADKLTQMNGVLSDVIDAMDNDTVLFVMGDHGMTGSGDHGGDSSDEIGAALFVYSPNKLRHGKVSTAFEINQIDIVPTISLLLGVAIPYGNLGTVVPDFFVAPETEGTTSPNILDQYFRSVVTYVNMKQVETYLRAYTAVSNDFTFADERLAELRYLSNSTTAEWRTLLSRNSSDPTVVAERLSRIEKNCLNYLDGVRSLCRQVWAQFDVFYIAMGIATTVISLALCGLYAPKSLVSPRHASALFAISVFGMVAIAHLLYPVVAPLRGREPVILMILVVGSLLSVVVHRRRDGHKTSDVDDGNVAAQLRTNWMAAMGAVLLVVGPFSNSFVVSEDAVVTHLFIALLWCAVITARSGRPVAVGDGRRKASRGESVSRGRVVALVATLVATGGARLLSRWWRCREEQWWCESSDLQRPLSTLPTDQQWQASYKSWRLFACVAAAATPVLAARWLSRRAGNANGFRPAILCACYSPVLVGLSVSFYWAMQSLPATVVEKAFPRYGLVLPNLVFFTVALVAVVVLAWPLCIYCPDSDSTGGEEIGPVAGADKGELLQHVYRHVKLNWKKHLVTTAGGVGLGGRPQQQQQQQPPLRVFGLASVFSAPLLALATVVLLLLMMISRDGFALAWVLLIATAASVLYGSAHCKSQLPNVKGNLLQVPWLWVLLWSLLSLIGFYATGHQQTFPTLHWEVGLIGSDGQLSGNVGPATKIALSTFAAPALLAFCLPMLLLWPLTSNVLFNSQTSFATDSEEEINKGEFFFFDNHEFFPSLHRLICNFLAIQALRMLSAMLAATWLRRHLMVWKIFAPKFIFEAIQLSVVIPFALFGYLLMMSCHAALHRWIRKLYETDKRSL